MPIRRRTLRLVATVGGFSTVLGELLITRFAKMRETWKEGTELLCPECGVKPDWVGYRCPKCGKTYPSWSGLRRVHRGTGEPFVKPRLTKPKEKVMAQAYIMPMTEFSERYADATLTEYGVVVKDENSAMNLMKLVVAVERLGQVVILKFNDTYEQRIALLTMSASNRVVLREIIPLNLLEAEETLRVDMSRITERDVEEAQALLKMLPKATEETLKVEDYRTIGVVEAEERVKPPKVQELAEILARVRASA